VFRIVSVVAITAALAAFCEARGTHVVPQVSLSVNAATVDLTAKRAVKVWKKLRRKK
jgi:hypothetical protein